MTTELTSMLEFSPSPHRHYSDQERKISTLLGRATETHKVKEVVGCGAFKHLAGSVSQSEGARYPLSPITVMH